MLKSVPQIFGSELRFGRIWFRWSPEFGGRHFGSGQSSPKRDTFSFQGFARLRQNGLGPRGRGPRLGNSCIFFGDVLHDCPGGWNMQNIQHQGVSAFNSDPSSYTVFRNVMDYGAKVRQLLVTRMSPINPFNTKGDGVTDDTDAIKYGCSAAGIHPSNTTPVLPSQPVPGAVTTQDSSPIVILQHSLTNIPQKHLPRVGRLRGPVLHPAHWRCYQPTDFAGIAVIDVDPYIPGGSGAQYYVNQNNFFRSVRNSIIGVTQGINKFKVDSQVDSEVDSEVFRLQSRNIDSVESILGSILGSILDQNRLPNRAQNRSGIEYSDFPYWAESLLHRLRNGYTLAGTVSQSTSLINIVVEMSTAADTPHQGIYMENGSGGFMGDLIFNGGLYGMYVGNQQCNHQQLSGRIWVDLRWRRYHSGLDFFLATVLYTVGAEAIIDATVTNTPIFVRTPTASSGEAIGACSLVLNNIKLKNVPTAVGVPGGAVVLAGGTTTITSRGQGNVYSGTSAMGTFTQGTITSPSKPAVLLNSAGSIYGRGHPQYATYAVSSVFDPTESSTRVPISMVLQRPSRPGTSNFI
ncbi:hypothetical protein DFH07DRAFT_783386 [Mycena maculata]|uniref:Rhamnogalacturonase A/B/Epimerase-like pectate lyase domain-containing protein n=1 Tax=Mycena maculata TaxID=230809 RepID=A0AAD7HNP7_9AGAR|nr:hypothetical protein DFH07DRAFT_783386 [Mycena maculata]